MNRRSFVGSLLAVLAALIPSFAMVKPSLPKQHRKIRAWIVDFNGGNGGYYRTDRLHYSVPLGKYDTREGPSVDAKKAALAQYAWYRSFGYENTDSGVFPIYEDARS